MGIILRERTNTRQSVQFTRLLVTVNGTELGNTQGQILVGTRAVLEDSAVVRAVHGFEQIDLTLLGSGDRLETVLAIVIPVTGSDVEVLVSDMRGHHLLITIAFLYLLEEIFQTQTKGSAFGQPDGQTFTYHV